MNFGELKLFDLITFHNDVYRLVWKTNYNFVEDLYIFHNVFTESVLTIICKDVQKIYLESFTRYSKSKVDLTNLIDCLRLTTKEDLETIVGFRRKQDEQKLKDICSWS